MNRWGHGGLTTSRSRVTERQHRTEQWNKSNDVTLPSNTWLPDLFQQAGPEDLGDGVCGYGVLPSNKTINALENLVSIQDDIVGALQQLQQSNKRVADILTRIHY